MEERRRRSGAGRAARERVRFPRRSVFAAGFGLLQGVFGAWAVHPAGWSAWGVPAYAVAFVGAAVVAGVAFGATRHRLAIVGRAFELFAVWVLVRPVALYYPSFAARDVRPRPGARVAVDSISGFFIAAGVALVVAFVFVALGRALVAESERTSLENAYLALRDRSG